MTKWNYEYDNSYYTNNGYLYSYDINNISFSVNSNSIDFVETFVVLEGNTYGYALFGYNYYVNAPKFYSDRSNFLRRFFWEEEKVSYTLTNKLCAVC